MAMEGTVSGKLLCILLTVFAAEADAAIPPDGTTSEIVARKGVHLDDWTFVGRGNPKEAAIAWAGSNPVHPHAGLYLTTWTNPHPEKEITSMDFISEGAGVPILVAVTGRK
jgi:hypothetical protein